MKQVFAILKLVVAFLKEVVVFMKQVVCGMWRKCLVHVRLASSSTLLISSAEK